MGPLNATVAGTAMATPLWYVWLQGVSEVAAVLLPIVGVILATVQVYYYLKKHRSDK